MFRKVMLFFLALAFCGVVVAGIDLTRHWRAAERVDSSGADLSHWHYRFSGAAAPAGYCEGALQSWPVRWHRMITFPQRAVVEFPPPGVEQMVVDRLLLRDLALLGVEDIGLYECRGLTPAVMSELSGNSSVRMLSVTYCDVTNEGANLLWSGCPKLEAVQFYGNDIGDEAFRNVKAARALKLVDLANAALTNQTIVYLREAPHLEQLILADASVGEDCGPLLAAMPRLRRVDLRGVTGAVAIGKRLRALRPDITVFTNPREIRDWRSEIGGN